MEAKQLQQSQQLVRQRLADKGLQVDDALQVVVARRAELREICREAVQLGLTEVDIARLAGVSRSSLRDWLGKT